MESSANLTAEQALTDSLLPSSSAYSGFPYLEAVIGFMICMYFFETYLDLRQHKILALPTLPATLKGVVSDEKFGKARAYSLDKSRFHFVHACFNILEEGAILSFGLLPYFWMKCGVLLENWGFNPENEILRTLAFLGATTVWTQQTVWLFFKDMILAMLLMVVLGPPIVSAIIYLVQKGGPYLALYLWGFMLVLSLGMMAIYPVLIARLFNKFTPLPEGELRAKIEKLASLLKFPLKKLFVIDGSTRSSHSNVS
ncbi:hypothetical protein AXG93_1774s1490 [Marchantia polymorpha subsp. ruderalis]|uniref:CAAX prenyl protease 1 N-terminal domain-containing protein n=1 Tax=Marchantia polymorpha subsp. ruderalis TaxID=1480154 RepID=A0A176W1Y4_MARPO|nr:hypothetical protein AXG93_1774s1490 [Marchantia polymorpha subsp. ruderalis]